MDTSNAALGTNPPQEEKDGEGMLITDERAMGIGSVDVQLEPSGAPSSHKEENNKARPVAHSEEPELSSLKLYLLRVKTSNIAIGAVLGKGGKEKYKPIEDVSRAMTPAELNDFPAERLLGQRLGGRAAHRSSHCDYKGIWTFRGGDFGSKEESVAEQPCARATRRT